MLEKEEHFPFNGLMDIHVLNLARLPEDAAGRLADWLKFLKAETEEAFKMLAEKNPVIHEAYCKLQVMSDDEANRMIYEARLKARRDEYSRIEGARREGELKGRREGELQGRQEGELKGRLEVARTFKSMGIPVEHIAQGTGLSSEDIAKL
jgi:predicted transposase/invertase (TIGR01784 family)